MTDKTAREQLIKEMANIIEHLMAYYKPTKKICHIVASELHKEYKSLGYVQLAKCKANIRQEVIDEIEKEVEPCHEGYKNVLCIPKRWWQQFKKGGRK